MKVLKICSPSSHCSLSTKTRYRKLCIPDIGPAWSGLWDRAIVTLLIIDLRGFILILPIPYEIKNFGVLYGTIFGFKRDIINFLVKLNHIPIVI